MSGTVMDPGKDGKNLDSNSLMSSLSQVSIVREQTLSMDLIQMVLSAATIYSHSLQPQRGCLQPAVL